MENNFRPGGGGGGKIVEGEGLLLLWAGYVCMLWRNHRIITL
jgi:hypothetical protein